MVGFCRIVLLFSLFNLVLSDSCEPNQGTEGIYDCVHIPKYDGYQWAICLSNQVLETQTFRKMDCKGSLYCWLPCTQSIYPNSNREHIPKECKCDPDENERRKRSLLAKGSESKVNIPTACYVPTWENSCNWYSKCLEAHSSCEGSDFNYAISYGEAMCSIFQRRYNSLTIAGKSWIRSSQKCIQDLMRQAFMPNKTEKCKDIRDLAYEIHSDCYFHKGEFCKLSGSDQLTIYWSIKQFYEHAFSEKFDEGMERFRACLQNDIDGEQRKFTFYVEKNAGQYVDENTFASNMAKKFNFSSHGLDWDVDKSFSSKHKQFYESQEYQVVQMFLSKRQVKTNKRRKRNSYQHLLNAWDSEYDSNFLESLATKIKDGLRNDDLYVLMKRFEKQVKLVALAEKKYRYENCYYPIGTSDDPLVVRFCRRVSEILPGTPRSIDTKFYLVTRRRNSIQMKFTDISTLNQFDPNKKTFVIIHGFHGSGKDSWVLDLRDVLLIKEDANVIVVDWRGGANLSPLYYPYAAANTQLVGYFLALLVSSLEYHRNAKKTYFHIIGHSLGAHVAGFAGKALKDRKLNRITGLDPAGPCFLGRDRNARLYRTDANFVDVIHTDGIDRKDDDDDDIDAYTGYVVLPIEDAVETDQDNIDASTGCVGNPIEDAVKKGLGYLYPMGHMDFYPNGGVHHQPGCSGYTCSHSYVQSLFTRSVLSNERFLAWECFIFLECLYGDTNQNNGEFRPKNMMGYYTMQKMDKEFYMYYLKTDEFKTSLIEDLLQTEKVTNFADENMCRNFWKMLNRASDLIREDSRKYCDSLSKLQLSRRVLCYCFYDIEW